MIISLFTKRSVKILLALILIIIGILTKHYSGPYSGFVNNHLGGIIYVVFWILLFSIIFPDYPLFKLVFLVLLFTCLIEFTQIIQNPFLSHLREYFIFRAIFGSTFNAIDYLYYIVGAIAGFIISLILNRIGQKKLH